MVNMSKRVRIVDIAAKAGVSIGTVDRVLHNRGHVSSASRERVEQVLQEMGYSRNLLASALATNKTWRVVALLPDPQGDLYWEQVNRGVEAAARYTQDFGFVVDYRYFGLFQPDSFAAQAAAVIQQPPDGLLFTPIYQRESLHLLSQAWLGEIPNVMINTRIEHGESIAYVGQDSYQSGVLAGRLLSFGLQRGQSVLILNLDKGPANAKHLIDKELGFRDYFAALPPGESRPVAIHSRAFENFLQPKALADFMVELQWALPDIGGIFVTNSRAHLLADVLPGQWKSAVRLVGFDLIEPNLRHLQAGTISFLINQHPQEQGYQGVLNLFRHLVLREAVADIQYLPLDIVVKENARYYLSGLTALPRWTPADT